MGFWGWKAHWRLYVRALAGLAAALLLLVLVLRDGDGASEELLSEEPAPVVSTTSDPTTTPSTEPVASATPRPTLSPVTSPAVAAPAPPAVVTVEREALLSHEYVLHAFAQGRKTDFVQQFGGVPSTQEAFLVPLTCYWDDTPTSLRHPRVVVADVYSWPNEQVVTTLLSSEASTAAAKERFDFCSDPRSERFAGGPRPALTLLNVGDEGFLLTRTDELSTRQYAGARVGASLILIDVRRSGRIPSEGTAVAALRAAVHKATGQDEGAPVAMARQDVPEPVRGYLSRTELPSPYDQSRGLYWLWDVRRAAAAIRCGDVDMATTQRSVSRHWGFRHGFENEFIDLDIAELPDGVDPDIELSRCRQSWEAAGERTNDWSAAGDGGFMVSQHHDYPRGTVSWSMVVFRSGSTLFLLDGGDIDAMEQIGPAVLTRYRSVTTP